MKYPIKREKLKIRETPVTCGHERHLTGSGKHNNQPKRQRTRQSKLRTAMREFA